MRVWVAMVNLDTILGSYQIMLGTTGPGEKHSLYIYYESETFL